MMEKIEDNFSQVEIIPGLEEEGSENLSDNFVFPTMVLDSLACSSIGQIEIGRFSLDKLAPISMDSKSWCNNVPKVLTGCQVELESESQIESILITKDSLSWTNVCLLQESYINFANFPRFACEFGPQIRILKLDKFFGSIPEISFISCCVSLKSLTIIQMDVRLNPRILLPSEFPNLSKTFSGVKLLSTENIYFNNPRQLEFFKNFLNRFPKLEYLTIPRPHGASKTEWETLKTLQSKYLIKPVIDYLNERHNNMNLPTNPIKRTVNAGGVFSSVFADLAQACAKNGAFLTNISSKQVENLFLSQDSTLGKILYLNDGINDRRILTKWIHLEKVNIRSSACDIRGVSKGNTLIFPQLKSIHLIFDSDSKNDPEFRALKLLINLMMGQTRQSVKELAIHWFGFGHDTPSDVISPLEIVKHLPNLVNLHVCNWKIWDDDLLVLLGGLKRLQHLAIEDCSLLTEFGFLGHGIEASPILQLSGLTQLEIVNRNGSGSITDECFERVFKNLGLKTFLFDVSPNLATKDGYNSLKEGKFSEHIEVFPLPKNLPKDFSEEDFNELRKCFKNFV